MTAERDSTPRWRGRALVSVACLFSAQFVTALVPFSIGALAPFIRADFGLSRGQIGLATSIIFTFVAVCSLPAGRAVDRLGVARSLALSGGLIAIGAAGLAAAGAYAGLAASLAVVGVGYALISPATNKGILAAAPPRARGRAMGVKQMGVTAGGALAAAGLPVLVQRIGFGPTLLGTAATVAAVSGAAGLVFHRVVGSLGPASPHGVQRRARRGALRRLLSLGAVVGAMIAGQHAVATYLTLFLVDRRGMAATSAGAMLALLHVSGTVARVGWGWVSDYLRARLRTIALIGVLSALSLLAVAFAGAVVPGFALVPLVVVLGLATQGGNAVYQTAIAEEDEDRAGWASGVGMTFGFAGAIVAPPTFGAAVDATGSYTLAFAGTAVLVTVGVLVVFRLARAPGGGFRSVATAEAEPGAASSGLGLR